ncbi:MAG: PD40 domain-containing protein [Myxococcales bacterium]|nr:PD40 domain-containing protein [Myxococcales bacterium]
MSADPSLEPRRVRIGPLVDHHRRQRGEAPPPIEADEVEGGWIYFVAEGEGKPAIHRIRSSGGEREVLSQGEDAEYPALLLSSGHLVAVRVREPAPDVHRESVILLDTLKQRRTRTLGSETPRARNPSAAPDSSWLVFEYGGASFSDLFRVDLRDGVLDRLTDDEEGNFEPAVSPDGQRIAFVSSRDGNAELYVMAADGKEPRRLSDDPANESAPRWSPDGRHLAFLSDRGGSDRIYVVDPAGESPTPRRLTLDRDLVGEGEHAWSPDGRRIVFVGVGDRTTSLWLADAEGGGTQRLSDDGAVDQGPCWSPAAPTSSSPAIATAPSISTGSPSIRRTLARPRWSA